MYKHREAWTAMQTHMPPTPSPHNTSNTSPSTDAWVHDVLSTLDQREDAAGAGGRFWLQVCICCVSVCVCWCVVV